MLIYANIELETHLIRSKLESTMNRTDRICDTFVSMKIEFIKTLRLRSSEIEE